MAGTPLLPLVDRILPDGAETYLRAAKAAGESNETISRRLLVEHDIDVRSETVRKWCIELDIAKSMDPSGCVPAPGGSSTPEAAA